MKQFTNKFKKILLTPIVDSKKVIIVCGVLIFLGHCGSLYDQNKSALKVKEQSAVTETIMVKESVLPPTAEKLDDTQQSKVKPITKQTQNSVTSGEQTKPTAQATTPATKLGKTLYPNEVIIQVKNWDQKLKFLKTHFEQTSEYDGVPISKSQGTLWYDKDKNLLRLDTLNTDNDVEQSAITDKKQILILDGQGHEVTTLSWQEWQQGQPNQALFDFGNYTALLARHNAVLKEPHLLELTPKEGEKYTLYLTLAKEDYFPTNIKIVADLMTTEAKLINTQKNIPLSFDIFRAGGLFK